MNTSSPESVASLPSPEGTAETTSQTTTAAVSKPTHRKHRPHTSKISSLPPELQDFVNESLHNHVPHKRIIENLAEKGHPGVNSVNLTKWTKSGFQLWLQERERFQCLRLKVNDAEKYFRNLEDKGKNYANYVNGIFVDIQTTQAMIDFDPNLLKNALQKDPQNFFRFVRVVHTRSLDRQRDDRIKLHREKLGLDAEAGPTEFERRAAQEALKLPDSWLAPTRPQNH